MIEGTAVCAHAESAGSIESCIEAGVSSIEHGEALNEHTAGRMAEKGIFLVPTINLCANWYRDFMDPEAAIPPACEYGAFFQRDLWTQPDYEAERNAVIESFSLARECGVKIAMGSDIVDEKITPYGRYSCDEIRVMAEFGMSPSEAIISATATAAEVIGLGPYTGKLQKGRAADICVYKKNPLDDLRRLDPENISFVISGGRLAVDGGRLAY